MIAEACLDCERPRYLCTCVKAAMIGPCEECADGVPVQLFEVPESRPDDGIEYVCATHRSD